MLVCRYICLTSLKTSLKVSIFPNKSVKFGRKTGGFKGHAQQKKARDKVFWYSIDSTWVEIPYIDLFYPLLFLLRQKERQSAARLSFSFYKTRKLLYQRRDDRPIYFAAPTSWLPLYLHALKKRADYYLLLKTLQSFLFVIVQVIYLFKKKFSISVIVQFFLVTSKQALYSFHH